jgi:hypothetical protein
VAADWIKEKIRRKVHPFLFSCRLIHLRPWGDSRKKKEMDGPAFGVERWQSITDQVTTWPPMLDNLWIRNGVHVVPGLGHRHFIQRLYAVRLSRCVFMSTWPFLTRIERDKELIMVRLKTQRVRALSVTFSFSSPIPGHK